MSSKRRLQMFIRDRYRKLLADVEGITLHENPSGRYDSNYWLNTVLLDGKLHVRGEEDAYREDVYKRQEQRSAIVLLVRV